MKFLELAYNTEQTFIAYKASVEASATYPLKLHIATPSTSKRIYLRYQIEAEDGGYSSFTSSIGIGANGSAVTAFCGDLNSANAASTGFYNNPTLSAGAGAGGGSGTDQYRAYLATAIGYVKFPVDEREWMLLRADTNYQISFTPVTGSVNVLIRAKVYEE